MFTTQKYDTTATLLLQKIFPPSIPKKKTPPLQNVASWGRLQACHTALTAP